MTEFSRNAFNVRMRMCISVPTVHPSLRKYRSGSMGQLNLLGRGIAFPRLMRFRRTLRGTPQEQNGV